MFSAHKRWGLNSRTLLLNHFQARTGDPRTPPSGGTQGSRTQVSKEVARGERREGGGAANQLKPLWQSARWTVAMRGLAQSTAFGVKRLWSKSLLVVRHSRSSRTIMFSSREKPPYAVYVQSEGSRSCTDTSGKSERLFLRTSDITSPSEPELSKLASGTTERRARDLTRMDLELLLNLVRSETRPTSDASSRHSARTSNAKPFSDASVQMQTSSQRILQSLRRRHEIPPHALCPTRTADQGSPKIKQDARAILKVASKIERPPRLLSAKKDS